MRSLVIVLALTVGSVASAQAPAGSDDFRVETTIHEKVNGPPVATIRTLLTRTRSGEVVYDFMTGQRPETTIMDIAGGRLALIDPQREIVTELYASSMFEIALAIRNRAPKGQEALFNPKFERHKRGNTLEMTSDLLTYEVDLLAPKFPSAAGRYEWFATWAARLNSIRPNNLPSTGRELVNHQIAAEKSVPQRVVRTIRRGRRKLTAVSKHTYVWALSAKDRDWIEKAQTQRASFQAVSIESYLGLKPAAQQAAR